MRFSNSNGFTLIEVMVVLAIIAMTGGFLAGFIVPHLNTYEWSYRVTENKYLCGTLYDILESKLRYGKDYTVLSDGTLSFILITEDGAIETVVCADRYKDHGFIPDDREILVIYRTGAAGEWAELNMQVYDDSELLYEQSAFIRSLYSNIP